MIPPAVPRRSRRVHLAATLVCATVLTSSAACAQATRGGGQVYADSLREPAVVRSVDGVLDAVLQVEMARLPVPRGVDSAVAMNLRSYRLTATTDPGYRPNDPRFTPTFPGPTFRVRRGDLVRIRLVNTLPLGGPDDANDVCIQPTVATRPPLTIPDVYQGCFHGLNFTNIHYHGMHVTPDSTSTVVGDDVLMVIAPGETLQYSFRVPDNQSPGTHWYHPHKHGSVAMQVANGMAGAFIVESPETGLDSIVRVHRMREHLVAIQQVAESMGLLGAQGELDRSPVLANGQFQPTIYMAPGEVQRWRIVNENTTRTTKTFEVGFRSVAGQDAPRLFDVARDGIQLAPANYDTIHPDTSLFMAPGQRLDVFVRAPRRAGTHYFHAVHNAGASRAARGVGDGPLHELAPDVDLNAATQPPGIVLFRVVVDPRLRGRNTTLPGTLPPMPEFLRGRLAAARDTALILFTDSLPQEPTQFYLGSRQNPFQHFDDNSVFVPSDTAGRAMPMVLGETQTWKIVNNSQLLINHPFHIHINPFQVDSVVYPLGVNDPFHALYEQLNAAARRGSPIWLDVLPLPLPDTTASGGNGIPNTAYAVITQKYDRFEGCRDDRCGPPSGYFVMHCHILGHEERGMMQVLQVVEPGQPVSPPQGHVPAHGAQSGSGGHRH